MKKTAFLYIRVSTDEQADTGYSQRYQEETLRRYCDLQGIAIKQVFYEDHSAKNFLRPEWSKIILTLRKHRHCTELILFTKWDRFSRNAGDAYGMINTLNKIGVEPQAIEQPLDLSVPENKMMLAFYLAAPEVENDRRALNVIGGMRRARKEGRFMGKAPIGYRNKNEDGKKTIVIDPVHGPIMKWVFEELARGVHNVRTVMLMAADRGLRTYPTKKYPGGQLIQKTPFWNAIRNPAYMGRIVVPAYKGEEEQWVKGNHEPLISEELFYQVQDVLDGKKRSKYKKEKMDARFPLRGFLSCPVCNRLLTASSSKGRNGYHKYYHCHSGCKIRFRAEKVDGSFTDELKKWQPDPLFEKLYGSFLEEWHGKSDELRQRRLKEIRNELQVLSDYKVKIRKKRINDELDLEDYMEEKKDCERRSALLEGEMARLATGDDIRPKIQKSISLLSRLNEIYENNPIGWKREFIGSMFPEKLSFNGESFRTAKVNEVAEIIFNLVAAFMENEKGQERMISDLSQYVDPLGHFSNRFLIDLHRLASLYDKAMAA